MDVVFYHNAADRLAVACELIHQSYHDGHRVVVLTHSAEQSAFIDRRLWTTPPTGFTPHSFINDALAAQTPVLLTQTLDKCPSNHVLVNLHHDIPAVLDHFVQIIEVVEQTQQERDYARARFKAYRQRGHAPRTIDLAAQELVKLGSTPSSHNRSDHGER